jgi:serine/threonine-protein kinase
MKYPVSCPTCGDVTAELAPNRQSATCGCGAEIAIEAFSVCPGCVFAGGYRVIELMPDPSDGFIALQEGVDRRVQIKVLSIDEADEEELARFQRQVKVSASLQHSHLITAYHAGDDCGILFLAVQYVDGESLARRIDRVGAIPEKEALKLLLPIAGAMNYAWREHQIIHRNLKPANIIVADEIPLIADLAIAKTAAAEASLTGVGYALGTPEYMSPEQARGEETLDCRCDVYAFGIMLYELVTGRPPFMDASPILVLNRQLDEEPTPPHEKNGDVSKACSKMIMTMLQKRKQDRYPDWDAVIAAMEEVLSAKPGKSAAKSEGKSSKSAKTFSTNKRRSPAAATPVAAPTGGGGGNWLYVGLAGIVLIIILVLLFR